MRLCAIHSVQVYATEEPRPPDPPSEVSKRQGFDKILQVFSALASESEQKRRVQRTRVGMAGRIAKGLGHWAAMIPYGYRRGPEGVIVPDPDEACWVLWMYQQRAAGWGAARIAAEMNRRQVPTPASRRPHATPGTTWHPRTVRRILLNDVYVGVVRWGEHVNPEGVHERLISRPLWDRVQQLQREHTRPWPQRDESGWLRGLLRCGFCSDEGRSRAMTYYRRKPSGPLRYLCCSYYRNSRGTRCCHNGHPTSKVHPFVTERICRWLSDRDAWQAARRAQFDDRDSERELAQIRSAIASQRTTWDRTFRAYQLGIINANDLAIHKTTMDRDLAALETRESELTRRQANVGALEAKFAELAPLVSSLSEAPYAVRARVARALIRSIHLRRGTAPIITLW